MAGMMQRPGPVHRVGARCEDVLGTRLRQVRDRQGLSLGTVASMLNVPAEELARIEAGTLTDGRVVERVARWLSLSRRGRHR